MNKTIYMTYHSNLPSFVTSRWLDLNPDYRIDFSMDADCISFLQTSFGRNIAELFKYIPRGMYKADLWRLCKLYIHGGVYADIDLVPHFTISDGLDDGSDATFYSCLNMSYDSIFQAFMKHSRARSPLLLGCLISFLINKPYKDIDNGPTRDMYQFLLYNIRHQPQPQPQHGTSTGVTDILPHTRYTLRQIRIPVTIPANEDIIPLYYFPDDVKYSISIHPDTKDADKYRFYIKDNHLFVDADADAPAGADTGTMVVDICIDLPEDEPEVIFLFEECIRIPGNISTCYISHQNKNIMDCRDARYMRDSGWVTM